MNKSIQGDFQICISVPLSHLWKDKIKHSFHYLLSPISHCESDVEFTLHYLLHSLKHSTKRHTFLNTIRNTNKNLIDLPKTA